MLKKREKKGFTLAELLIVIAIIAILIAIAVPVFASSMRRANEATDCANIRALKAAAVAYYLDDQAKTTPTITADTTLTLDSDGDAKTTANKAVKYKLDAGDNSQLAALGIDNTKTTTITKGGDVKCTVKTDGTVVFN